MIKSDFENSKGDAEHMQSDVDKLFSEGQHLMDRLYRSDAQAEIEKAYAHLTIDRERLPKMVCCVDEGVPEDAHYSSVGMAGSGALLQTDEQVAEYLRQNNIQLFTTHEVCTAHKMSGKKEGAKEWGEMIAAKVGIPFKYFKITEMLRPPDLHPARVIYYKGTEQLKRLVEMPKGFLVSHETPDHLKDLDLCIQIALGDHGFGKRFTVEDPLVIIPVGSNEEITGQLAGEAYEIAKKYDGVVDVDPVTLASN